MSSVTCLMLRNKVRNKDWIKLYHACQEESSSMAKTLWILYSAANLSLARPHPPKVEEAGHACQEESTYMAKIS